MAAIKNFFAGIGVYAVPVLSIMAMVLVFYIPRFTEFWNYLRLAPFYAGIYFWISQRSVSTLWLFWFCTFSPPAFPPVST